MGAPCQTALIGALGAVDGTVVSYYVSLHFLLRCGSLFQRSQASVIKGFLISQSPHQILFICQSLYSASL
jgi:hypothetical protein